MNKHIQTKHVIGIISVCYIVGAMTGILIFRKYRDVFSQVKSAVFDRSTVNQTSSQDEKEVMATYNKSTRYLNKKIDEVNTLRASKWNLDFSSLNAYDQSIQEKRKEFQQLIGVPQDCLANNTTVLKKSSFIKKIDGVALYRWELTTCNDNLLLYCVVGIPEKPKKNPYPVIIALHGQGGSPSKIMGLNDIDDYHHQFGLRLAKEGFMVVAPHIITEEKAPDNNLNRLRNQLHKKAVPIGMTLLGLETSKLMGLVDYLSKDTKVDKNDISEYGISLGGEIAFFHAAMDTRVRALVVSQYITDRIDKYIGENNPDAEWKYENSDYTIFSNFLLETSDARMVALVAPRKLFIEAGSKDGRTTGAIRIFPKMQEIYKKLGLSSNYIQLGIEQGGHEIYLNKSLQFILNDR